MINSPIKVWRTRKYHLEVDNPGKLVSYSVVHVSSPGFEDQVPYFVGLVEMKNGSRVMGQITEAQKVSIGQKMKVVLRVLNPQEKEGVIHYGIKFKPWPK
jgi:uncharacterized OB-fold protein